MLDAFSGRREGCVVLDGFHPGLQLGLQLLLHRWLNRAALAVLALDEHPQRTAVGAQLADVEDFQTIALAQGLHGGQRQVGIVFVIQRVELRASHQRQQLREFEGGDAGRLEQRREAYEEIVDVRHMGEHVVGRHQVSAPTFAFQLRSSVATEEQLTDLQAFFACRLCSAARRFNAQAGNAASGDVLQQVTVVGGDFHHTAVGGQAETLDHLGDIALGMGQPGAGERTEVGVLGVEQAIGAGVILGLHQPALLTHRDLQRHPLLGLLQAISVDVGVGRWRGAEVDQRQAQRCGAPTAVHRRTPAKC
ncbi:hypothetical protein D3C87_1071050 [compost metagenome]